MKFDLDGLTVYWPYDAVYPEQYDYMLNLKHALDAKGGCLLESPTGTGKTCSLLALITSYQLAHPECGKLIFCTRTVPEMTKAMEELKRVIDNRTKLLGGPEYTPQFLGVCLSSRRNMCVNSAVVESSDRERVDSLCRKKIAPWIRQTKGRPAVARRDDANGEGSSSSSGESKTNGQVVGSAGTIGDIEDYERDGLCSFYERYIDAGSDVPLANGIYTIDEMKELGKKKNWCPYFVTRHVLSFANVVVYNYQYMLDPKVSQMVSKEISRESIVVFDEAHNIDNVCIEALSVNFNRRSLDAAAGNVKRLHSMINKVKETDATRLRKEYEMLVQGLSASGALGNDEEADVLANPLHLPEDILNEAVPGNIRKAEHFVKLIDLVVKHLNQRMRIERVVKETPQAFIHELQNSLQVDAKTLQFSYSRLSSLMRTLKVVDLEEFVPVSAVADFLTLVSLPKYQDGFMLVLEPYDPRTPNFSDPIIQFACLDASLAIKPVLDRFQTVVITSGTLSPIDYYPKLLDFKPVVSASFSMSIVRPCICPMVVTRGSDQTPITSAFSARGDKSIIINYGALLTEVAKTVPDGIVCFFPSYDYLEMCVTEWFKLQILDRVLEHKLLFIETKDIVETTLALDNYRKACDCGRGAVFLSIARGKVSEGIDFDRHYGRAVILYGIPYQYAKSQILLARLEYLRTRFGIREEDFLTFDALRNAAQCIGRVIRSKTDYGLMIFADKRYNNASKRSKLPPWVTQFLTEQNLNLSTEEAVTVCREFLRKLAQPPPANSQMVTMLTKEDLKRRMSAAKRPNDNSMEVDTDK